MKFDIGMKLNANDRIPFLLRPAGKDYLWGGSRLKTDFGKDIDMVPLAETWECSTHPDGLSMVSGGIFDGWTLEKVLSRHPDYLGTNHDKTGLPILIKLIDAKLDLSVQVHPDDEYARTQENGQLGKTEMWYVIDASPNANLTYGFHHDMDKRTLLDSIRKGNVEKYLNRVFIHPNEVFFVKPGTVHAIGAGALIAEVQESSNLTYRLYDYNRIDKAGKKRTLHIKKAMDVINLKGSSSPRQPMRVLRYHRGCASEFLCRCKYFQVERVLINTERVRELADYRTGQASFQVLLCTNGCGVLMEKDSVTLRFFRGDCIFVPANSVPLKLHGNAQFLKVTC
ncbi:type I phosphomannose isomerase catalytic subunit [Cloacibacillus evryensis]